MDQLTPSRYASRSSQAPEAILAVLQQTLFCTLAYSLNGSTKALPTGFCLVDNRLFIHGSGKSRFLEELLEAKEVCISAFLFDGLVLATSAFDHSVNYRSVTLFSSAEELSDVEEKASILEAFTEKYIPGRWPHLRPVTAGELKATRVLGFDVAKASLKSRSGAPGTKKDAWAEKIWSGVVPAHIAYGEAISDPNASPSLQVPDHVTRLIERNS